jgi:hypothetical protein
MTLCFAKLESRFAWRRVFKAFLSREKKQVLKNTKTSPAFLNFDRSDQDELGVISKHCLLSSIQAKKWNISWKDGLLDQEMYQNISVGTRSN